MRKEWIPVIIMGIIILVGLYLLMFVDAKKTKIPAAKTGLIQGKIY